MQPQQLSDIRGQLEKEKKRIEGWLGVNAVPNLESVEEWQRPEVILNHQKLFAEKKGIFEDIAEALERFKKGIFGLCIVCAEEIAAERILSDLPRSLTYKRCCPCQKKNKEREIRERQNIAVKRRRRKTTPYAPFLRVH
jgi:RNA polymerase-binding transcription factor DksA